VTSSILQMNDDAIHVSASGIIEAPASTVWATVADFGTVATYLPSVAACRLEGSGLGARRVLSTTDGGRVVSELIELDDDEFVMGYRIVESALPFVEYTSRVRVLAVDAERCEVTWHSIVVPRSDTDTELDVETFLQEQLDSGIDGLRRLHEDRRVEPSAHRTGNRLDEDSDLVD
jgi:Polyketide cyclase / dehydrase and lipid transport